MADDRLRRLERAAAIGDQGANEALARERCRVYGHMLVPFFGEGNKRKAWVASCCVREHCGHIEEELALEPGAKWSKTVPSFYVRPNQQPAPLIRVIPGADREIDFRHFQPVGLKKMTARARWLTWVFWRSCETPNLPHLYSMPVFIANRFIDIHQDDNFNLTGFDVRVSRRQRPESHFPEYIVRPMHRPRPFTEAERKWLGRDLFSDWGTI